MHIFTSRRALTASHAPSESAATLFTAEAILEAVKALESAPPAEVTQALTTLSWRDRAHAVTSEGARFKVCFYSDGLDLKSKMAVENAIRGQLSARWPDSLGDIAIFMERKDKPVAAGPSGRAGAQAQQATSQAATAQAATTAQPGKSHGHEHKAPSAKRGIPGVKRIVAVASGKGGVGKSTVSVNLALALHNQGYKVGLLDADIYGPSLPMMLGLSEDPTVNEHNKIVPPLRHGLKVMSFGFFAGEESAVIWRGPMVMKALQQFFYDVDWGELDFLIVDMPPGTGDAQLTLVQSLPIAGSVIVTTPQNVALLDAVKGVVMFRKTDVPIIGVVENMSTFHCPSCGTESHIFGEGGAERVSGRFDVPVLGQVPLISEIRAAGDSGAPLTTINGHPVRVRFAEIAERVVTRLIEIEKSQKADTHILV